MIAPSRNSDYLAPITAAEIQIVACVILLPHLLRAHDLLAEWEKECEGVAEVRGSTLWSSLEEVSS